MQNSARCVLPVTSTSKLRKMRSTSQGERASFGNLLEGDFHFVEAVVAGFVDARGLARRADEQAGK